MQIRIRGSKRRGKFLQKNIIASNGILHIIDKAMDFVEPTLESNTKVSLKCSVKVEVVALLELHDPLWMDRITH